MEAELRVAYLTSAFARPGDTFIRNEVNVLRELGAKVDTYSIRRPPTGPDPEPDIVAHQQGTHYILETGFAALAIGAVRTVALHPIRFLKSLALAWRTAAPGIRGCALQAAYLVEAAYLAGRLLARRTQLLHNHIGENSASVAMLAAEMSGLPFSLTIHGPYIFFAPRKWALGEKLSRAAFTACISHFCRSQCLIFAPESAWPRIHVLRCSVQPVFIEEPRSKRPAVNPHFVCVARLCVEKGQRLLVEAVSRAITSVPHVRVTIVGDGPDRQDLERLIREANLQSQIEILGWRSSTAIREMLIDATALVIPSMAEGLPIVAMEALACRCPVIATNIAAMAELIEPGQNGWLIAAGSIEELATAIQSAAECSPEQLQQMGECGRRRVLEMHEPKRQTAQLLEQMRRAARHSAQRPE